MSEPILTPEEMKALLTQPKKVSSDAGSVENHSIKDMIDLDKHLSQKKLYFPKLMKIQPPRGA